MSRLVQGIVPRTCSRFFEVIFPFYISLFKMPLESFRSKDKLRKKNTSSFGFYFLLIIYTLDNFLVNICRLRKAKSEVFNYQPNLPHRMLWVSVCVGAMPETRSYEVPRLDARITPRIIVFQSSFLVWMPTSIKRSARCPRPPARSPFCCTELNISLIFFLAPYTV